MTHTREKTRPNDRCGEVDLSLPRLSCATSALALLRALPPTAPPSLALPLCEVFEHLFILWGYVCGYTYWAPTSLALPLCEVVYLYMHKWVCVYVYVWVWVVV